MPRLPSFEMFMNHYSPIQVQHENSNPASLATSDAVTERAATASRQFHLQLHFLQEPTFPTLRLLLSSSS